MVGQSPVGANAASDEPQCKTGQMIRVQEGTEVKVSSWEKAIPKRSQQKGCEDRAEMQSKLMRCTLLPGSAWSTERKYIRRYKGTFDFFFGVEHRLRKEEMEEQFNKEAKQGWRHAADSARITDEKASSEDRKHTSGGVFVAVDSNLGAVVGKE